MGEGGVKVHSNSFLKKLRKICNQKKILLILDEVQCGIGRSGKFFAFEHAKIKPDIVPIAKGIGGGFPIGAVLMNKKVAPAMTAGSRRLVVGRQRSAQPSIVQRATYGGVAVSRRPFGMRRMGRRLWHGRVAAAHLRAHETWGRSSDSRSLLLTSF